MPRKKRETAAEGDDTRAAELDLQLEQARQAVAEARAETQQANSAVAVALVQIDRLTDELGQFNIELQKHEKLLRRYGPGTTLLERWRDVIGHYQTSAVQTLQATEQFRADLIVQLRAFELVVEMAGNGATHAEKGARLRGLSEMLSSSVEKLRDFKLDDVSIWRWPDVFRTDFPTRAYLDRIHELEAEVKLLRDHPMLELQIE